MSMKKAYRIKKEKDFQTILKDRQSYANRNIILFIKRNPNLSHFRIGLSVGKKIGNAVQRNRVKRQLREGVYALRHELPMDIDLVMIARPAITSLTTREVKDNIRHVCRLAKII